MSTSSYNQENLQKLLCLSMTNSFCKLIEKNKLLVADKAFDIEATPNTGHIMFTIAGLEFRTLVLLHYPRGKNALHFLNLFAGDERGIKNEKDVEPFYTELGNQFCGEIKRHLHRQFYHLGMSTPSLLSPATSLLDIKNPLMLTKFHHSYELDNQFALGGSIYAFSKHPIHFSFDNASTSDVISTGELEFF